MSKQLSELCTILVDETFGGLPSVLFGCLVSRGRVTIQQLLQLSSLSPRYLRHALAVLVQLRLVSYHTSLDDGVTYYEANVRNAYDLIRIGKHAQLIESQFGKNVAAIVSEFQCQGFIGAHGLLDYLQAAKETSNTRDGVSSTQKTSLASANTKDVNALSELFLSRHVVKARNLDFIPALDLHELVENMVQEEKFPAGPKGKQKVELLRSVLSRKRHWRDDNQASWAQIENYLQSQNGDPEESYADETNKGDVSRPRKQRKLNGGIGYGGENGIGNHDNRETNLASDDLHLSQGRASPEKRRKRDIAELEETSPRPSKQRKVDRSQGPNRVPIKHAEENSQHRLRGGSKISTQDKRTRRGKLNGITVTDSNGIQQAHRDHEDVNDSDIAEDENDVDSRVEAPTEPLKPPNRRKRDDANGDARPVNEHKAKQRAELDVGDSDENAQKYATGVANVSVEDFIEDDDLSEDHDEPYFRLNTDKFDVLMRSQRLVELATKHFGEPTSKVFAALLRCLERKIARCHDEFSADGLEVDEEDLESDDDENPGEEYAISTLQIDAELDPKIDLAWVKESEKAPKDRANAAASVRSDRIHGIEQHLEILAEHAHRFVHPVSVGGETHWHVDFHDLSSLLIHLELEDVISTRFDEASARIVRFLNAKGKLDEKRLADLTLILQKDLRAKLAALQEVGYVDLQEVPRDIGRQPSRTIFLWFFDQERCRKLILDDTYKAMARLLQRAKVEKEKVQSVIEKSQRTDVVGREDEYLSATEKAALKEWHRKEEMIWIQVARLDDMVAILRDFLPPSLM